MNASNQNGNGSDNVLRLHMEGIDSLEGDVRLGTFIDKLSALKAALAETEHLISGEGSGTVDFLVSELTHSSPAMIGVRAHSVSENGVSPIEVLREFSTYLSALRAGKVEVTSDRAKLVGHLRKLVAGLGDRFSRLWIDGAGLPAVALDQKVLDELEKALPLTRVEIGSVTGVVKRYSGVSKQMYFKVIPPIGGVEVKCVFGANLIHEAAAAVENTATIEGELHYYEDSFWPYEVRVASIDVHKKDAELPTLQSLKGIEPGATEGQSSIDYLRELRGGW